jgi:hypothetical protein
MKNLLNVTGIVAGLASVLLLASACSVFGRGDDGKSSDRVFVLAPIEAIDIVTRESFPPQYSAHITSGLPSGCAKFEKALITGRSGNAISIEVWNSLPADRTIACTAIYGYFDSYVDLGSGLVSGQVYRLDVNGTIKEFTAQ